LGLVQRQVLNFLLFFVFVMCVYESNLFTSLIFRYYFRKWFPCSFSFTQRLAGENRPASHSVHKISQEAPRWVLRKEKRACSISSGTKHATLAMPAKRKILPFLKLCYIICVIVQALRVRFALHL
jgi:hypothetical protein